jgi:hypothetical protein
LLSGSLCDVTGKTGVLQQGLSKVRLSAAATVAAELTAQIPDCLLGLSQTEGRSSGRPYVPIHPSLIDAVVVRGGGERASPVT